MKNFIVTTTEIAEYYGSTLQLKSYLSGRARTIVLQAENYCIIE